MRRSAYLIALMVILGAPCAADGPLASAAGKLFGFRAPHNAFANPDLAAAYEKSGASAAVLNAVWAEIQPVGAKKLDFAAFDNQPLAKSARTRIVWIDLATSDKPRATDPEQYWKLADAFITELIKRANAMGIKHFAYTIRQEQPESSVGPTAKSVEPLKHIFKAAEAVSKDNIIIAEQPHGSGANAIEMLYRTGAKGSFDVAMVHAVAKAGGAIDPFALVAAHREMARNGDENKKLMIIGGWEPTSGSGEIPWHVLSAHIASDYRDILTERDIHDSDWVLGEIIGLPDMPSADFIAAFPPVIPETRVEAQLTSDSPVFNYVTGRPYKLSLTVANLGKEEMKLDAVRVAMRGDGETAVESKPEGETPKSVPAGGTATATLNITIPKAAEGKQVTVVSTVDFTVGDKKHAADAWLTLTATPEYEVTILPSRLILDSREGAKRVGMSVINHADTEFQGKITLTAYPGITVSPTEFTTKIDALGLEAFVFTVTADAKAAPGHYAVFVDVGGKAKEWQAVDIPLIARKAAGKVGIDGKLDDWKDAASARIGKAGAAWLAYDDEALYAAVQVEASEHVKAPSADDFSQGDSLLIGLDPLMNGARGVGGGYKEDDYEFAAADTAAGPVIVGTRKSAMKRTGQVAARLVAFRSEGGKSVYEVAIPWEEITPLKAAKGPTFGVALLVNSGEGAGRSAVEWGGGLSGPKDPRKFLPVVLAE